jgi:hypothetical protein
MGRASERVVLALCVASALVSASGVWFVAYRVNALVVTLQSPGMESHPLSTTYTDVDGQSHTVNSPLQADPQENVRVHIQYLTASYCAFLPEHPPAWFDASKCPH